MQRVVVWRVEAFCCSTKMIYYALGFVAVVFYVILRKKVGGEGEPSPPDSDWDARSTENLSRTLRERFTRF